MRLYETWFKELINNAVSRPRLQGIEILPSDGPAALPEISAQEASGEIRDIYDAIAAALGVRLVNLVYRHLATVPGALEWAWGIVGERFADGTFAAEAAAIAGIAGASGGDAQQISLGAAGLAPAEADAVLATLDAYNRANPMNAISLQVIALALAEGRPASFGKAGRADTGGLAELLPIAPLDGLPPDTRALLATLAQQATGGRSAVVPSLFRHFTAWPPLLEALSRWLGPVAESGAIDDVGDRVTAVAQDAAARIFDALPPPAPGAVAPDDATRAALAATVRTFPPAICRMIAIGALLRAALVR